MIVQVTDMCIVHVCTCIYMYTTDLIMYVVPRIDVHVYIYIHVCAFKHVLYTCYLAQVLNIHMYMYVYI